MDDYSYLSIVLGTCPHGLAPYIFAKPFFHFVESILTLLASRALTAPPRQVPLTTDISVIFIPGFGLLISVPKCFQDQGPGGVREARVRDI